MRALILGTSLLGLATSAQAQQPTELEEPAEEQRFRLGPLRYTPWIAITDVGFDDNVFNETINPKRDSTAAVGPAAKFWLKAGRSQISGKVTAQYLYYQEFENQRAWNTDDLLRWEVPLARITPFVNGTYVNARQRPGYEIDARVRSTNNSLGVGTDIRPSPKTSFVVSGSRNKLTYDREEQLIGAVLSDALDRTTDSGKVEFRYKLTPLTTFATTAEALGDHFTYQPVRDARSIRVMSGFELKPAALIAGKAFFGFRHFNAIDERVPDYQGFLASVDVTYSAGATQVGAKVSRDLSYSYEVTQPYYTLSDRTISVTQRITHTWDVVGRIGWQTLDYHALASTLPGDSRTDTNQQLGFGVGYRIGRVTRIGLDVNHYERRTGIGLGPANPYDGLRVGASMTYGLQP